LHILTGIQLTGQALQHAATGWPISRLALYPSSPKATPGQNYTATRGTEPDLLKL
jgi:hypothetical protein